MEHFAWYLYVPEWHYGSVTSKWLDAQMGRDSDSYGNTILYADIDRLRAQGMAVPPFRTTVRFMCLFAQDWSVKADSAHRQRP